MGTWVDRSFDNVEDGAVAFTGMVWRLASPPSVCPWWDVEAATDLGS